MKKFKKITTLMLAALLLFCTACSTNTENTNSANSANTSSNANSISIGVYNFDTYNPIATVSHSVTQVSALIFDSLVKRKGDQSVEPALCSSYSVTDDGLTYTFTLKDNIRWHDGDEFVAADVDYTFKMIEELEQSAYKSRLSNIESYMRDGKNSFVITLKRPDGGFINFMDIPIIKSGTDCKNSLKEYIPIGTGAYKYVNSDLSRAIRLVRNEEYSVSQKPLIEEIIIKQLPDKDVLTNALEAREIEVASFTAAEMRNYNPKGNLNTIPYSNSTLTFIGINTTSASLDKSQVRRALSYAIDRKKIQQNIFFGRAQIVNIPLSTDSYLFKSIYKHERDTDRALQLLSEAGYTLGEDGIMVNEAGDKLSFELIVNSGNELRVAAANSLKSDFLQIGIDMRIKKLSFEDYKDCISSGSYELFLGEIKIGRNFDISSLAGSNARYSIYSSERIDALLRACKNADNAQIFESSYNELTEVFLSEMPIVSILMSTDALVLNSKIKGVGTPVDQNVFANIASWYIEN